MRKNEFFIGLFVILAIIGIAIGVKKAKKTPQLPLTLPTPGTVEQIQKTFNVTIPAGVEKADLKAVGNIEGIGVATRKWQNGKFNLTILADLPAPVGQPYRVWLESGTGAKVQLGTLRIAKGGYLLDFESTINYSGYKKVVVAQVSSILEGSF